jgi:hypothetical protein
MGVNTDTRRGYTGDLQRDALMHWRRFRVNLNALRPDQAAALWRTVSGEIAAHPIAGILYCFDGNITVEGDLAQGSHFSIMPATKVDMD